MKRKIYLVQPAYRNQAGRIQKGRRIPYGSLALPGVSAAIPPVWEKEFYLEYFEEVRWDTDASVVGITSMGYNIIHGYEIADEFRRRGKTVVFGGPQAWLCPSATLRHADAVVLGHPSPVEMEAVLEDALRGRLASEYRCGMSADVPFDYTVFSHARMDLMPVATSLGCRGACSFCCIRALYKGVCRLRRIESVIEDIKSARARARRAVFVDANIYGQRDHLLRLCKRSLSTSCAHRSPSSICSSTRGHGYRGLSRCLLRLLPHRHEALHRGRVSLRAPPAPARLAAPTHSHLRAVLLSGSRHASPGRSQAAAVAKERREPALARREGGPASPTWSVWLPRAGSATIHPGHPSASVHPRSRSPSCPYPPNRAAPPHGRQPFRKKQREAGPA